MSEIIIADTSCLIVLQKIGRLTLLQHMFNVVTITPEVRDEYQEELPPWISVCPVKDQMRQKILELDLDPGESSSIALALEHPNPLLLIDERKGRLIANELQIPFTGTLGILIRGKTNGLVKSLHIEIDQLKKINFRMSESLIHQILNTYESDNG